MRLCHNYSSTVIGRRPASRPTPNDSVKLLLRPLLKMATLNFTFLTCLMLLSSLVCSQSLSPDKVAHIKAATVYLEVKHTFPLTGQEVFSLDFEGNAQCVTFSPDGKHLLAGGGYEDMGQDYAIKCWSRSQGSELQSLRGHFESIGALAFSANADRLVSCSYDGTADESGEEVVRLITVIEVSKHEY